MQNDRRYVTYDEVASTACHLQEAGEKVTSVSVRAQLGRGSFSTLQKFIEKWEDQSGPTATLPRPSSVPPQLESLWQEAQRTADAALAGDRRTLDAMTAELDEKLANMEAAVESAELAKRHAEERLQDKNEELARLNELLQAANTRADRAEADLRALRSEQMQDQKAQLETLRATLHQVEVRLAPFDATLQKVHAGIKTLGADADTEIKRERSLWAKRIDGFEGQIAGLTKALRIVAEPVANLSRGFDELVYVRGASVAEAG